MRRIASLLLVAALLVPWATATAFPADLFDKPLPQPLPEPLRAIQQRHARAEVLQLDFRQRKWLPELQQPLASSGRLTIVPDLGLEWRVTEPFPSVWRVSDDGRVIEGPESRASRIIGDLLIALLSMDVASLESTFDLYWSRQPSGWWLGLRPRDERLRRVIESIAVAGDETLRKVEVHATGGDRTEIRLTSLQTPPLTDALRARFSQ